MASASSIHPLPADAIAQIRSSITITSLNGVVLELIKNSLDAHSHKIDVSVEYGRGSCTVEDDGLGIPPAEFKDGGGLGKLYYTSKYNSPVTTHGSRGSFLASLAALSLVSITSHHHLHHSHNTVSINRSQVLARQVPAPQHQRISAFKHGTRVTVRDLFGNMPVRVKQRAIEAGGGLGYRKDWEELRKGVTNIVLAWPMHLSLTIRDTASGQKIYLRGTIQVNSSEELRSESKLVAHVCSTLSQATLISSPDQSVWVSVNASTPNLRIQGAISLEPAPTKAVQFLSLGIKPLSAQGEHNLLYEDINRLFVYSSFGNEDDLADLDDVERERRSKDRRYKPDGFTNKELRGSRKGLERWPMFFIKIELLNPGIRDSGVAADGLGGDKSGTLSSVVELLHAMILQFLRSHHFQPKIIGFTNPRSIRGPESTNSSLAGRLTSFVDSRTGESATSDHRSMKKTRGGSLAGRTVERGAPNVLGTNMRPRTSTEAHMQRFESPFNTWSRVKTGRPNLATNTLKQPDTPEDPALQRVSGAPQSLTSIQDPGVRPISPCPRVDTLCSKSRNVMDLSERIGGNDSNSLSSHAIIDKSGKVIRPPFGDLQLASLKVTTSFATSINKNLLIPESKRQDDSDQLVAWVNPITNERSLVNSRTGLAVQSTKNGRVTQHLSSLHETEIAYQSTILAKVTLTENPPQREKSNTWISGILGSWHNPVFRPTEEKIPRVSMQGPGAKAQQLLYDHRHNCPQSEIDQAFRESSAGFAGRISKEALRRAEVISQVDKKFILVKISASTASSDGDDILVIVDQHAADERCRIENFMEELCTAPVSEMLIPQNTSVQPGILTTILEKPISVIMAQREIQLLQAHAQHFADWGILYDLPPATRAADRSLEQKVTVRSLPPGIIERCKTVPKLLIELLRSEAWKYYEQGPKPDARHPCLGTWQLKADGVAVNGKHAWVRQIHGCPQGILDMLNSRSCRSAIMFNDEISHEQCKNLMSRLVECAFPFQCAHGRPSMIPLVVLGTLPLQISSDIGEEFQNQENFGAAFRRWKRGTANLKDR